MADSIVATHDGQVYEDEASFWLNKPMEGSEDLKKSPNYDPKTDVYQAQLKDSGEDWYKDPKLDWNDVPMNRIVPFNPVPNGWNQRIEDFPKANDFIQKQIESNKLKPGEGFTIQESDGPKTYQYMGPHLPPGQNFLIKRPAPPSDKIAENKQLYFVRHGDTDLNEESGERSHDQPIRGWSQVSLNDDGRKEAKRAAKSVKPLGVTHMYSSDLNRAKETAGIIAEEIGVTPQFHPGLRTWDLGDYTEQTGKDVHDKVEDYCNNKQDERPPGSSESFNEFRNRILNTTHQIASEHPDDHEVLLVSHNSPERVLDEALNGGDYNAKGIEPGEHKVFNFNQRFEGQASPQFDPSSMNIKNVEDMPEGFWKTETPKQYPNWSDLISKTQSDVLMENMPGSSGVPADEDKAYTDQHMGGRFIPLFGKGDTLGDQFKDLMLKVADRPEDKDIQRIKIMPGMLSGPQAKGAKQFMSQEEAMANLAKGLRGRMREGWKPGPGSYKTREKTNIDTSVQIKPEKPVKQRQPEPGTVDPEYEKAISDWMKNQFEGGPIEPIKQETISKAAIRHPETGKVYEGSAHFMAVEKAAEDYPGYDVYSQPWEEGFTTNTGRYVDRKEALGIALQNKQIKPEQENQLKTLQKVLKRNPDLISEDLKKEE